MKASRKRGFVAPFILNFVIG